MMMNHHGYDNLIEELAELFTQSPHLSHLLVCESAAGNSCGGGHDLVLAFHSGVFKTVVETLDLLLLQNFSLVFPGFPASSGASDRLDFIYLFGVGKKLHQVKITLTSTEKLGGVPFLHQARLLYENAGRETDQDRSPFDISTFVKEKNAQRDSLDHFLIEVLLTGLDVQMTIECSQIFLNYAESYALNIALRNLLRAAFDREHLSDGWHNFRTGISRTQPGYNNLAAFERIIFGSVIHNQKTLSAVLHWAHSMVREAAPETCEKFQDSIDFYFKCFDQRSSMADRRC